MNKEQLDFLNQINIDPDAPLDIIEGAVADYLETHGFDKDYNPTAEGKICESILDFIGEQ